MFATCLLVTNLLCIANDYRLAAQRVSLFTMPSDVLPKKADPDVVQRLGVEITVVASDSITPTPIKGLDIACVDGNCTYYRKYCDEIIKQCVYSYGSPSPWDGKPTSRKILILEDFSINYQSDPALRTAEKSIYLVVGDKNKPSYIPLSQLKLSSTARLPVCQLHSTEAGC